MRAAPLLLLTVAACSTLVQRASAPLPPVTMGATHVGVRVQGVVTDRWGYAVPDAWVTVRVGMPVPGASGDEACAGASHLPTRTRTSPLGEFDVIVDAGARRPFLACLEIEALPPSSYGLRENRAVVPDAAFTTAGAAGGGDVVQARVVLY